MGRQCRRRDPRAHLLVRFGVARGVRRNHAIDNERLHVPIDRRSVLLRWPNARDDLSLDHTETGRRVRHWLTTPQTTRLREGRSTPRPLKSPSTDHTLTLDPGTPRRDQHHKPRTTNPPSTQRPVTAPEIRKSILPGLGASWHQEGPEPRTAPATAHTNPGAQTQTATATPSQRTTFRPKRDTDRTAFRWPSRLRDASLTVHAETGNVDQRAEYNFRGIPERDTDRVSEGVGGVVDPSAACSRAAHRGASGARSPDIEIRY